MPSTSTRGVLISGECGDASDPELGIILARLSGRLHGDDTRHLSGDGVGKGTHRSRQLLRLDRRHSSHYGLLLLSAEADNDNVVKDILILHQRDMYLLR